MEQVGDNKPEMKTKQLRIGVSVGYDVCAFPPSVYVLIVSVFMETLIVANNNMAPEKAETHVSVCCSECAHKYTRMVCKLTYWNKGRSASTQTLARDSKESLW